MAAMAETAGVQDREERPRIAIVFGGLMLVLLLAALDQTIVATALPTIVGELGGLNHISWVVSAYLLAQTVVTPVYGKLGDLYGRKRVLQVAIVIFLVGSALCGASNSMLELIAFRALQGLGGGGLIVLTQAAIGDVVPPRQRGRYQGYFGAVFGVASVLGPLLGGFFVDTLSWRWIFYVNLPVGAIAVAVITAALPASTRDERPVVDYLGAILLGGALSCIVLVSSLGGTTWPWSSARLILTGILGLVLLACFAAVERQAEEPILPPSMFRNRVFTVASGTSMIVGFAMFGAITFLPLFFQTVNGDSPTASGLRLLPMMGGLLLTSIASGQIITRIGRYRIFPIMGTAIMVVGFLLLSRMDVGTGSVASSAYLLVLGMGIGLTMQVLVLAVQNAVDYAELGTATSGVLLFRLIGGSLGTALFGTIFSSRLAAGLAGPLPPGISATGRVSADQLARLPAMVRDQYLNAFTNALSTVFVVAAGVAAMGFLLVWLLEERPLRETAKTQTGIGEAFAAPRNPDSLDEISTALSRLDERDARGRMYERLAERAGVDLDPLECWALARANESPDVVPQDLAERHHVDPARVAAACSSLLRRGMLANGGGVRLTPEGRIALDRLLAARQEALAEHLADWSPEQREELVQLLRRLAGDLPAPAREERPLAAAR
jgi:EmrB/QacA subfamily drug resistance transporter